MQVRSIAECSNGSILQYFRPSLSYHLSLRSLFCLFLSGRLRHAGFTVGDWNIADCVEYLLYSCDQLIVKVAWGSGGLPAAVPGWLSEHCYLLKLQEQCVSVPVDWSRIFLEPLTLFIWEICHNTLSSLGKYNLMEPSSFNISDVLYNFII